MGKEIMSKRIGLKILQTILIGLISGVFILSNVVDANSQSRTKSKNKKSVNSKVRKVAGKRRESRESEREREREREEKPVVIVRNGKKYVLSEDRDLARFDQPAEAQKAYLEQRLPKGMKTLPVDRYFTAIAKIKRMQRYSSKDGKLYPSEITAPGLKEGPGEPTRDPKDKTAIVNSAGSTSGVLGTWSPLGPGNVGGRTRALLVDPTTPNTMYAAGVAGGIWKSTNGGASWTALDDFLANIAVSSLAFEPGNSSVLYAGTGEGFFNADSIRGAGIFKSTDAGVTWTRLAVTANNSNFFAVNDIVVGSGANSQHVFAATGTGVWRSLDGGTSWTQVLVSNASTGVRGAMDLVIRTDQATDYVFAAMGSAFSTADAQSRIFRNTDAGGAGTWVEVYTEATMGRTSLAIAPSNQNVIYALSTSSEAGTFNTGLLGVFRSTSSGDVGTWTTQVRNTSTNKQDTLLLSNPVNGALVECGFGATNNFLNQGWYDNVLAVDPTDENKVWAGGIDIWRSDNGGANWGVASYWWFQGNGTAPANGDPQLVHADNHAIVFHPGYNGTSNQTMFVGDDGGIYRTDNAKTGNVGYVNGITPSGGTITATSPICGNAFAPGETTTVPTPVLWNPLNNGYAVTQFYEGVVYPDGKTYFGGTQDNGTNRGTDTNGPNSWERINGGDGGYVAVDPSNTNVLYSENTGNSFSKSTNGGVSFFAARTGISGDTFPFTSVFRIDPNTPSRLWYAGRFMWRTDNSAGSWVRTSDVQQTGGSITAMAIAPGNSDRVITGAASGQLRRTTIGTTTTATSPLNATWLQSFTPRGNGFGTVSWVEYDPSNSNNLWATFSTFNSAASGNGFGHVFKSIDGGATWTLADGNQTPGNVNAIPDIPAHSIAVDPTDGQRIYIGTDLGVFVTLDGGANWAKETTGFSNVPVESLWLQNNNGVNSIYAFTHGRSAFKVTVPASCVTVSPTNITASGFGQTGTITITKNPAATAPCDWNAVSNSGFITLSSSLSGVDSGSVTYTAAPNATGASRSGTVTVAGTVVTITQLAPTAANVSVSGRLLTASGSGIKGAIVTITDGQGNVRSAKTNTFGYYRFEQVVAGATYILTPSAKGYTFNPPSRVLNVQNEIADADFTAGAQ